jgi:NhaP-type Na+/H+ or K+/H+ antiporter
MSNTAAKVAYKPVGLLGGIVAGAIAGLVFRQLWKRMSDEEEAPDALQREYPWREIVLAAAIQGAIFAVVRAVINRGGAEAFRKLTGTWPGD